MRKLICCFLFSTCFAQGNAQEEGNWFPFQPSEVKPQSAINMQSWLDAPAGRHGFVQSRKDQLVFADGTPVKFWGVNIASNNPFAAAADADRFVHFMASYGINAVRFHKFTWDATDGIHSTQLTPAKWNNFDYFSAQLKAKGIYYSWSHIYGHRIRPADSSRLLAYTEVANTKFPWSHLNGSTASLVNFAEDLQALNIELTVKMLEHVNPKTGLRYADDPALAFVELQNEDNIFWSAMEATLKQTPTYRALLCRKFSDWLLEKYGSQQALEAAWGRGILPEGESLEKKNIYPQPNHGLFSHESEKAWKNKSDIPRHITDKAFFLFEEQAGFYNRFVAAIRNTGYKGLIVGSCWQAGSGLAHLLNLYADYGAGVIDRHNYFGGGGGHRLVAGKVANEAMVNIPGSGLLSTGLQQVSDRPFFISEWMSLIPNEWTAESAPLIAAYGLGLQGWDASFAFALDFSRFTQTVQSGHGVYNVTSPTQLALYPALAAMVYRNDVREGSVVADRQVSIAELRRGQQPFFETVAQETDVKSLQSVVPLGTLALGRVVLSFTDSSKIAVSKQVADLLPKEIKANNGQLQWHYRDSGYVTLNTKGTQGVIGFAANKALQLGDLSLQTSNPFAEIMATSLDQANGINKAKRILITTMARARNTGMKYNKEKTILEHVGEPPILLEPVNVRVRMKGNRRATVFVLDHSGNRTGIQVPVQKGSFVLNGDTYKAIYYEVITD